MNRLQLAIVRRLVKSRRDAPPAAMIWRDEALHYSFRHMLRYPDWPHYGMHDEWNGYLLRDDER